MKRSYQKPEICIENFLLSEMIASCEYRITMQTSGNCATNVSEDTILSGWKELGLFDDTSCMDLVPDGMGFEWAGTKLCYHTSMGYSVFAS